MEIDYQLLKTIKHYTEDAEIELSKNFKVNFSDWIMPDFYYELCEMLEREE